MDEEDEDVVGMPEKKKIACSVCSMGCAKYKCPRCLVQTCSLACVKRHKEDTPCSGARNKSEYRSLTDFTDKDLRSDYHFLTDVERVADSAHRQAYQAKLMLRPQAAHSAKSIFG